MKFPSLSQPPSLNRLPVLFLLLLKLIATRAKETCPDPWVEFGDTCYLFERGSARQFDDAQVSDVVFRLSRWSIIFALGKLMILSMCR